MATIDESANSGRRNHSQELPLVPFIDLLFCCVMFLLATAVWNSIDQIPATQPTTAMDAPLHRDELKLYLYVHHDAFTLASNVGERIEVGAISSGVDYASLSERLAERRRMDPAGENLTLVPDDDVAFEHLVHSMDLAVGEGFVDLRLSGDPMAP